ncbi:hypothetical protein [Iningainema tapete]|uniref:DUF559 domain-containing protein n=1 Tax=Iningainema tapete BLCC-T55 TaxID=2748662 RepID=A0A8J6XF03_9CYAN|nr:hypothetical protein [Iningainema tapete]MBD2772568.1 hypothetical protein [Iningainema tapete BLCC-T55]
MSKGFYPVVIYPTLVSRFCAENPLPIQNVGATPELILPVPPRSPQFYEGAYTWVLRGWLISVAALVLTQWLFGLSLVAFSLALGSSAISGVALWYYLRLCDTQAETRYKQRLAEYQQQLSEYENRYNRRLKLMATGTQKNSLLLQTRQKKLKALLNGRIQLPCNSSNAQQGVSEEQFFRYLLRYFPTVCQGMEFEIPNSSFRYSADFILYHQQSGLGVDIEVDEPYEGRTGEPHHCVDQGKDSRRNQFFIDNNWIVIRFSEKQVVQHPDSCCKVIASAIAQITGDYSCLASLQDVPALLLDKQWTIKQAKRMAKTDYRQSYLSGVSFPKRSYSAKIK